MALHGQFISTVSINPSAKLFKTYRLLPKAGYDDMVIGLNEFRVPASGQLLQILKTPFISR